MAAEGPLIYPPGEYTVGNYSGGGYDTYAAGGNYAIGEPVVVRRVSTAPGVVRGVSTPAGSGVVRPAASMVAVTPPAYAPGTVPAVEYGIVPGYGTPRASAVATGGLSVSAVNAGGLSTSTPAPVTVSYGCSGSITPAQSYMPVSGVPGSATPRVISARPPLAPTYSTTVVPPTTPASQMVIVPPGQGAASTPGYLPPTFGYPQQPHAEQPPSPPNLTQGIPDPVSIERQKFAFQKGLEDQLKQGTNVLDQQLRQHSEYLTAVGDQQKRQYSLQVDMQIKQQEMSLMKKHSEQLLLLQQTAQQQKSALEHQANALVMDYESRKAHEDLLRQQYDYQRRHYETQLQHYEEMRQLEAERAQAAERLQQLAEQDRAALLQQAQPSVAMLPPPAPQQACAPVMAASASVPMLAQAPGSYAPVPMPTAPPTFYPAVAPRVASRGPPGVIIHGPPSTAAPPPVYGLPATAYPTTSIPFPVNDEYQSYS